MGAKETRAKRTVTAERRQKALEMRKAGATYMQIGNALGISNVAAHKHVMAALKVLTEKTIEDASEVLRLELERLDQLQLQLWTKAKQGHLGSIDRILKVMDRRAKLLGIDAPEKRELTGPNGAPLPTRLVIDWGDEPEA